MLVFGLQNMTFLVFGVSDLVVVVVVVGEWFLLKLRIMADQKRINWKLSVYRIG